MGDEAPPTHLHEKECLLFLLLCPFCLFLLPECLCKWGRHAHRCVLLSSFLCDLNLRFYVIGKRKKIERIKPFSGRCRPWRQGMHVIYTGRQAGILLSFPPSEIYREERRVGREGKGNAAMPCPCPQVCIPAAVCVQEERRRRKPLPTPCQPSPVPSL